MKNVEELLPWNELAKLDIIILLKYLLVSGYSFDNIIFFPNIFSRSEHKVVHKVSEQDGMITIYVNNFYLPLNLYTELTDEVTDEYDEVLLFLFKIDSVLLQHKYKMIFIEDLTGTIDSDVLLSSRSDIFPGSPLAISDLLTEIFSKYGSVVINVKEKINRIEVVNNLLDGDTELRNIVIGNYKEVLVKNLIVDITLNDDYVKMCLHDVEAHIRKSVKFQMPQELLLVINLIRFPVMSFVVSSASLGHVLYVDELKFIL